MRPAATLDARFAEQVREHPDRCALRHQGGSVTYRQLDEAAGRLARLLARDGVGRGDIVPVVLERTHALPATLLAAARLGALFCVIDPAWPRSTRDAILTRLGAPTVSVDAAYVLQPDPGTPTGATGVRDTFDDHTAPACVVLTSGSTGVPRPAVLTHAGVVRLFGGPRSAFAPGTALPVAAAVAWDGFAFELWNALLGGGTAHLISEPFLEPAQLVRLVRDEDVDGLFLITSLFHVFVDADLEAFTGLRTVVIAGEAPSMRHVEAFTARHPGIELINAYGPVEGSIATTWHRVTPVDIARRRVPIGEPCPGTTVAVWDGATVVEGPGTGELIVGGDGVFLGYLGDLPTSAAKILVYDGRRYLRTGDVVRRHDDGAITFVGRTDNMIKIGGHRIELEGVEHALLAQSGVRRAVAFAVEDPDRLVAVVEADPGFDASALRARLAANLPSYMVPAQLYSTDSLPLMANGKPDRSATRTVYDARQADRTVRGHDAFATNTSAEAETAIGGGTTADDDALRRVLDAFAAVIGERYDPEPDVSFVEAGGTSVQLPRLIAALRRDFDRPVKLADVIRWGTPRTMARELSW